MREFASEKQNYWSRDRQGHSEWQGRLIQQWGLSGDVDGEPFRPAKQRLAPAHRSAAGPASAVADLRRQER